MISRSKKSSWTGTLLMLLLILSIGILLTACNPSTKKEADNELTDEPKDTDVQQDTDVPQATDTPQETDTDNNSDPNPAQTDQDEPETSNPTQPVYFGEWVINQVQAFGVGTYSGADAEGLIGKSLIFNTEQASHFGDSISEVGKVIDGPKYTEIVSTESDFVANYRISFDDLGIEEDKITEINVIDSKDVFVSTFLIKDDDTLIIVGGGTYFELLRQSKFDEQSNNHNNNERVLAYVKELDTVNKTITFDEVELLFSEDVERLAEIGKKSEDLITGFYLYNEVEAVETISYDDTLSIELFYITEATPVNLEDFHERINNTEVLCSISLSGGVAVSISEQYLP
ncbi:MAG TPA: hypothetical protein VJ888_02120 [Mobilitalea sp.]|nr:hypothetical protein [Mobilitalea sp.]